MTHQIVKKGGRHSNGGLCSWGPGSRVAVARQEDEDTEAAAARGDRGCYTE